MISQNHTDLKLKLKLLKITSVDLAPVAGIDPGYLRMMIGGFCTMPQEIEKRIYKYLDLVESRNRKHFTQEN